MRASLLALVAALTVVPACSDPKEGVTDGPTAGLGTTGTTADTATTDTSSSSSASSSSTSTTGASASASSGESTGESASTTTTTTAGTTDATATTADTSGVTSGGGLCGDGEVGGDEECDDGNMVDDDACSNACALATCSDGLLNQGEEKADCGGPCAPCCALNSECAPGYFCKVGICKAPVSCADLLATDPNAADGDHVLDPDGPGGDEPVTVRCDMQGGGWSCVYSNTFDAGAADWSKPSTTTCGSAKVLGKFGSEKVSATVDTYGIPHQQLRLRAAYYAFDSWDDEKAYAQVDGAEVWTTQCNIWDSKTCGHKSNLCQNALWRDGVVTLDVTADHAADGLDLAFGAMLDEGVDNESFGVDDILVCLK